MGQIVATDYFESRARERGQAWLFLDGSTWHVMLPHPPAMRLQVAYARPVTACRELGGWQWRLELEGWHLLLPRDQIKGLRPALPEPFTCHRRALFLYSGYLEKRPGQSFFGVLTPGVQPPMECRLFLVREVRPYKERRNL